MGIVPVEIYTSIIRACHVHSSLRGQIRPGGWLVLGHALAWLLNGRAAERPGLVDSLGSGVLALLGVREHAVSLLAFDLFAFLLLFLLAVG